MTAPTIQAVYPNDESTGIPIGAQILITFSEGVDLTSVKNNIVVYGRDYDVTSGSDSATWIDSKTGSNPYFLQSPGFTGLVPVDITLVYVDSNGDILDPQPTVLTQAAELAASYRHKVIVTPKEPLAANVQYSVYIVGLSEVGGTRGISQRTIWDTDDTLVVSTTGTVFLAGSYSRNDSDQIHIKITTAGNIGTAQYKWCYDSELESEARTGKITSRKYRLLEDGIQIRFDGSGFLLNDQYTISLEPYSYLATSYNFSFVTGTGNIISVPDTASTSVIGTESTLTSEATVLEIVSSIPADGATNQKFSNRKITVEFSNTLDADTITDDSVTVTAYPISGTFDGPSGTNSSSPVELLKKLTVSGSTLTIEV